MKASVTSLRAARLTTRPPRQAIRNPKNAAFPHWPGETHTCPVASIIATTPKFVGLKRCLPRMRSRNLLAIVTTDANNREPRIVGAQQQAEREAGNQGAPWIEGGQLPDPRAGGLRQERDTEQQRGPARRYVEVEPDHAVAQQRTEHGDLVVPRVSKNHGLSPFSA